MRDVFVGNLEPGIRASNLERLFSEYGRVERVEMKSGYAFVCFEDELDAEDAIRGMNNTPFGYKQKRELSVKWARGGERRKLHDGKAASNQRPTKTLFVTNFDRFRTSRRDIKRHFEPYGKVLYVCIRHNFAFVRFATQEDATKALNRTHNSKILDRLVYVEYALRDDDEREKRHVSSPRRRRRSPSPVYRILPSPRRRSLSPVYRRSPKYDKYKGPAPYERQRNHSYFRYRSRSPIHRAREKRHVSSRRRKSPSPGYRMGRPSPEYDPFKGPAPYERQRSPSHFRYKSRSPIQRAKRLNC